ncbi:MAG: hypothetical protein SO471_07895 [Anaerobutyricum hallii]|nr:hypothetical protein [Anaerobutyricum hallii]
MSILIALTVCDNCGNCAALEACHSYCSTRDGKRKFINEIIAEIKELQEKANEQEK